MNHKHRRKIAIIANSKAGVGTAKKHILNAKRELWGWEQEFFFPESVDHARSVVERLDPNMFQAIVVMGGDGTFNKMLPALMKSPIPCIPFPSGTANDFARELNVDTDWTSVQLLFDQNMTSKVDVISANGIPFITVAGIGVGALLTDEFNKKRQSSTLFTLMSRHLKAELYTFLSVKTVVFSRKYNHEVSIKSDQFSEHVKASAVFICNQDKLGGDITVAPRMTKNDDGRFNVLIVPKKNPADLIKCLVNLKKGIFTPDLVSFSATRLKIESQSKKQIAVFGDGEVLTESNSIEFQIHPEALTVFRKPREES